MARNYPNDWRKAADELERIARMIEKDKATDDDDHQDDLFDIASELRDSADEYEKMHQPN